jgi:hypothetical protein
MQVNDAVVPDELLASFRVPDASKIHTIKVRRKRQKGDGGPAPRYFLCVGSAGFFAGDGFRLMSRFACSYGGAPTRDACAAG